VTGHHIYTRSWFEYGSKSQNAGTFTVELTDGIFGDGAGDVIYDRLNPMCASVSEALAPRDSGQSLLRVYHLPPDTVVVCRSWFVTDQITGRGTVPYAYSLIFRGESRLGFLRNPEAAFRPEAMEPYQEFCARVTADAPAAMSVRYNPKREDYSLPPTFEKADWTREFRMERDSFVAFFASLGKAVCGRGDAKVGVILPKDANGERFVLAALASLPMLMKKKFGAASRWTGMMDGRASGAAKGLQLLCYYDETPASDSGFPVVDLTGAGRHERLDAPPTSYAGWLWDKLDDTEARAQFEAFLSERFGAAQDRMPFEVIDCCHILWELFLVKRVPVSFERAMPIVKLITDCFAKNFSRFPFISEKLEECLLRVREGFVQNLPLVGAEFYQALCLLAANGHEMAKALVYDLYKQFRGGAGGRMLSIALTYYAGILHQPNRRTDPRALEVLRENLSGGDPRCVRIAQDALRRDCQLRREVMLTDAAEAEEAFSAYRETAAELYRSMGRLPEEVFTIPENPHLERLYTLTKYDISSLGCVPSPARWAELSRLLGELSQELVVKFLSELYPTMPKERKVEYFHFFDQNAPRLPSVLLKCGQPIRDDVERQYFQMFAEEWKREERPLGDGQTWQTAGLWLDKLETIGFLPGDRIFGGIREGVGLNRDALVEISASLSVESMQTVIRLYGATAAMERTLERIRRIDGADSWREDSEPVQLCPPSETPDIDDCKNRMDYWEKRGMESWALKMSAALIQDGLFSPDLYLELRRAQREQPRQRSGVLDAADVIDVLSAVRELEKKPKGFRRQLIQCFKEYLSSRWRSISHVSVFSAQNVVSAFAKLAESDFKQELGRRVWQVLLGAGCEQATLNIYYPAGRRTARESSSPPALWQGIVAAVAALLGIAAGALLLFFGNGLYTPWMGGGISLVVPYVLAFLILVATVLRIVFYSLRKRG
jgi:hypothetical protein